MYYCRSCIRQCRSCIRQVRCWVSCQLTSVVSALSSADKMPSIKSLKTHLDNSQLKSNDGKVLMPFSYGLLEILHEMQSKLAKLEDDNIDLKKALNDLENESNEHINKLTSENDELKSKLEVLSLKNDQDKGNINGKILTMTSKMAKLEIDQEASAVAELNDSLLVSGTIVPPENSQEDTKQIALDLMRNQVKINLQENDILSAQRVGPKTKNGEALARKITIKLASLETKRDIFKSAKTARPANLYINECLIPTRQKIHYVLRLARKNHPNKIVGLSTSNGSVFIWLKTPKQNNNLRLKINTIDALKRFLECELDSDINDFAQIDLE